jgi:hypothetical protein
MSETRLDQENANQEKEDPVLARIKNRAANKDKEREQRQKQRGEALGKMFEEEGKHRAAERQKEEERRDIEKTEYFSTSMRITVGEFKRFNDLAYKAKMLRGKLTYENIFALGLESLEGKSDLEFERHIMKQKKAKAK